MTHAHRQAHTAYVHALAEWRLDIIDSNKRRSPHSMSAIDRYIRDPEEGCGWTWEAEYVRNGQFMWCGAFVGACYRVAGIHGDIARSAFPSTMRLDKWAKYQRITSTWSGQTTIVTPEAAKWYAPLKELEGRHTTKDLHKRLGCKRHITILQTDTPPEDLAAKCTIRRGDILLVGGPRERAKVKRNWRTYGSHVAMAIGPPDERGYVPTVEGNAKGQGPDGRWREGVVLQWRPIGWRKRDPNTYHVRRVIRPSWLDFVPTLRYED